MALKFGNFHIETLIDMCKCVFSIIFKMSFPRKASAEAKNIISNCVRSTEACQLRLAPVDAAGVRSGHAAIPRVASLDRSTAETPPGDPPRARSPRGVPRRVRERTRSTTYLLTAGHKPAKKSNTAAAHRIWDIYRKERCHV